MRFFSKKSNKIKFGIAVVALTFAIVNYAQLNNNQKPNLKFKVLDAKADIGSCGTMYSNFTCYYYSTAAGATVAVPNREHN